MSQSLDYGSKGRVGVLLPSGNTAVEAQFSAYGVPGLSMHFARLRLAGSSPEELMGMTRGIEQAASLLKDAGVDLVAFHCTAVTTWAPELEQEILHRITESTGLRAVATSQALIAALNAVGANRLVMLSPYVEHIATREEAFLRARGFSVLASRNLNRSLPSEMLAVTPDEWLQLLAASRDERADAYLVSCTATTAMECVPSAERLLDRPVITSNSAMLWHASRMLGLEDGPATWGSLGSLPSRSVRTRM